MKHKLLALLILGLAVPLGAEEVPYNDGPQQDAVYAPTAQIRYVQQSVTLQRSSEDSSEEAQANVPFLPGDRLSTNDTGRAEMQFTSGMLLRVDTRSALEYSSAGGEPAFRLDGGGLYVHAREGGDLTIDTPGGRVMLRQSGVFRIDADSGETRLTVLDGAASLDSAGHQVDVRAGERTYARQGEPPESPQQFDRGQSDDFAGWDRDRDSRVAHDSGEGARYLPAEVAPYAADLDANGTWDDDPEAGHVWRPNVSADWSPYSDGRWTWTAYGWTWCPYETWGWAPFHYGRWGFGARLGWYWIPGSAWGPAWVSWAYGGNYVGWCPLGFHNRPIFGIGLAGRFGRGGWLYTRRADILSTHIALHQVSGSPNVISALRVASPGLQPTRNFRGVQAIPAVTARLRGPAAIGSRAVVRPTTPSDRAHSGTSAPPLASRRLSPQTGTVHPTDQRSFRGATSGFAARPRSQPAMPRSQASHPTDTRALPARTPDRRNYSYSPSTAWRSNGAIQHGNIVRDSGAARPSAPRTVQKVAPTQPRAAWGRSGDSQAGGSHYSQPPRQQSVPRSQTARPSPSSPGPQRSQPHYSAPSSAQHSAPRPAQGGHDRRR